MSLAFRIRILSLAPLLFLAACSWQPAVREPPQSLPTASVRIETHVFEPSEEDSVVGQLATVSLLEGDTLLDIARHYDLGYSHIAAANPELDVWLPPGDARPILPLQFILPQGPRRGIVINLAAMRLFYFSKDGRVYVYPVGVGREGRTTPLGVMSVVRKTHNPTWYVPESIRLDHQAKGDPLPAVVLPGPDNPLGEYAFYLDRPNYLIHGTNKPYSIGLRASNGCLRLYPEHIVELYAHVAVKTPVRIINQPYLLGWLAGEPYLEAHRPFEEIDAERRKKDIRATLRQVERNKGIVLDWARIETVLMQARGLPVPIRAGSPTLEQWLARAFALMRPPRLHGQPQAVQERVEAWYVKLDDVKDAREAARLAALLNHQGPRIPARVVAAAEGAYVLAGPYPDAQAARAAVKRLRVDLALKGQILSPAKAPLHVGSGR